MLNKCQFVKESQYRHHKCLMYVENLKPKSMSIKLNTSYLTDSYIVFTLKMESVSKNTIFGLKMIVKSGLEKIFLKFLHAEAIFFYFILPSY